MFGYKKYYVSSGELDVAVWARNPRDAAIRAINKYNPKTLGLLMQCNEIGHEECYLSTVWLLNDMGKFNNDIK